MSEDVSRLSLNTATTKSWTLAEAVDGTVRAGLGAIGLWRDRVAEAGLPQAAARVSDAGLRECRAQHRSHTPKPVWNPDLPVTEPFREQWLDVPANADLDNGFKLQWEEFLADAVAGRPHRYDLLSAARGVQLAELGLQSSAERRTLDIPEITL